MEIKNTGYHSLCIGKISRGCRMCVKGRKLVLFVTGICPRRCYYCPLSEQKKDKDVIFANERPVASDSDIIEEAEISRAWGASITGGDPLSVLKRTLHYIRLLKKKFGKGFHIHLYTTTELINEKTLKLLYSAGLDEIRFHPDLSDESRWERILPALKYSWDVGIEIPAIPGTEDAIKRLCDFSDGKIKFMNINELEISDTNANKLLEKRFRTKDRISYAVLGSEALAKKTLSYCRNKRFSVHYCTAKLKDSVQLAERIKIRAKSAKEKFDIVTKEGLFIRGAIYLPEIKPGFSYKKKIKDISDKRKALILRKLNAIAENLFLEYAIPRGLMKVDLQKMRIITAAPIAEKLANEFKKKGLIPAVLSQYPTFDQMEIELRFL
ncbi:MAG: radical SAM protein [Candidatus Woesearchaeota archaeon]|nr:radical SAM protein [Candidatus Woesearchaeota archaeon]